MLPKIIRTGIHRYEGTGVRKTEMATQYRKAYVPVTLDVDKEGAILPRLIWWDNGVIFQIDQILYKYRAASKKVGGGGMSSMSTFPGGWMKRFSGRSSLPKQCPRTISGSH